MNDVAKNKSIAEWVHQFGDGLYSWAYYKTRSEQIAKDLVQETFIAAFESFDKFQGKSAPKSWLFAILRNKISDHYRKNSRNIKVEIEIREQDVLYNFFDQDGRWKADALPVAWQTDNINLLDDQEFEKVFQSCLHSLPYHWFCCIQLKYFGEKDSTEICQTLNITSSNLWQILHRTKLKVRKCLENNWFNKA